MTTKIVTALSCLVAVVLGFSATAFASGAIAPDSGSLLDLGRPVYDAIVGGEYVAAGAFALVLAAAMFKRYAPGKAGEFAASDFGGTVLVFAMSFGGALGTAAAASETPSLKLAWAAVLVGITAIGGYVGLKKLAIDPLLASSWYQNKAPAWLKAAMGLLILWVFTKKDGAVAITKAERAGTAAVVARPALGVSGVVGGPADI